MADQGQAGNGPQNDQEAPQGASEADMVAEQVGQQWRVILQMMTARGATRADIMELALVTARAIISLTANPLWEGRKGNAIPMAEVSIAALFVEVESTLAGGIEEAKAL